MVLRIIVYPIFAVLTFLLFLVILFPFESLKGRLEAEAERNLGDQYDVSIGDFSVVPLTGVAMKKIHVSEKTGERQILLKLDAAKLHVNVFPLLWGTLKLGYDLRADGGRVSGRVDQAGSQIMLEADIRDLNLAAVPWMQVKYGLAFSSDVDGKVDMELYPQAPLRNNGSIQLQIENLKMAESNIKNVLKLPPLDLASPQGKSKVDIVMNRGSIEIRSLNLRGGDLTLGMGGKIYLAQRMSHFRFNLRGKMGLDEKIVEAIPLLMVVEKQKGRDGLYPLTVTGQFRKPNIRVGTFRVPI